MDGLLKCAVPLVSLILAASVPIIICMSFKNRTSQIGTTKGIGWQFIRYTTIAISLPVVGLLALNGALTGEAATLIAGAMGYAFGKSGEKETDT